MKNIYKILIALGAVLTFFFLTATFTHAALTPVSWIRDTVAGFIRPGVTTDTLRIPSLTSCDTIDTDADGDFACGTDGGGGGGSTALDLGDNGSNESSGITEIAVTGDTNSIFTEPSADKLLIAVGSDWPKADTSDDLTCTDCINQTEIEDLYVFNQGDTIDGEFKLGNGATSSGLISWLEDTDNGSNYLRISAPSAITTTQTCTLENDSHFIPDSCVGDGTDANEGVGASSTTEVLFNNAGAVDGVTPATFSGGNLSITSANLIFKTDATTGLKFITSGITGGNIREYTGPDSNGTLALLDFAQTFTNKTIDSDSNTLSVDPDEFKSADSPADEECYTYESTGTTGEWQTCGGGSGASTALDNLAAVAINTTLVSDTTNTDDLGTSSIFWRNGYFGTGIELGNVDTTLTRNAAGQLNIEGVQAVTVSNTVSLSNKTLDEARIVNGGFLEDGNGNELILFTTTASAVNELTLNNAATGNNPRFSATGGDTNIGIDLLQKGTGSVNVRGNSDQSGELRIYEDTDAGTNFASFKVPALAGNTAYTLPADDGDSGEFLQTDGSGVLDWVASAGSGDITSVGDVASGAAFDGTQGTILTFNDAGGDHTIAYDTTNNWFEISSILNPSTNDGATLGNATQSWSDLFLASGAVTNWNNGDMTLTHSSNALRFGGGIVGFADAAPVAVTGFERVQFEDADGTNSDWSFRIGGDGSGTINFAAGDNTLASPALKDEFDTLGEIAFYGHDGTNYEKAAYIRSWVDAASGNNDMPGNIVFATTPDGSTTPATRVKIDNAGNLLANSGADNVMYDCVELGLDPYSNITTGTSKDSIVMPYAMTVTHVYASLTTGPTGSVATFDINEAGTSIISTKITIDASETSSQTAATPAVISDSAIAKGAILSFDIDGVGSTTPGNGIHTQVCGPINY